MNELDISTYCEPDFRMTQDIIDEFVESNMTEEEKEERHRKTMEMYSNFTDDDFRALGDCF